MLPGCCSAFRSKIILRSDVETMDAIFAYSLRPRMQSQDAITPALIASRPLIGFPEQIDFRKANEAEATTPPQPRQSRQLIKFVSQPNPTTQAAHRPTLSISSPQTRSDQIA